MAEQDQAARKARIEAQLRAIAMAVVAEAIVKNPAMKDEYLRRLAAYQPSAPLEQFDA